MNSVRTLRARFALASLVCLSLSVASADGLLALVPQRASPPVRPPELLATAQRSFSIPFSINAAQADVVEVVLQVSRDRGKTWQEHSRRAPGSKGFPFTSSQDGEFWFAIQTLNRNGVRQPADQALKAELRIAVDTRRPGLEFEVRPDAAGRIVGSWIATDPNIDPCSLTIRYQNVSGEEDRWHTVPTRTCRQEKSGVFRDELAWWPETAARNLKIRARIRDLAGNETAVERVMVVPLVAGQAPPRPARSDQVARQPAGNPPATGQGFQTNYLRSRLPVALAHLYGDTADPTPAATVPAKPVNSPGASSSSSSSSAATPDSVTVAAGRTGKRDLPPQPPRTSNRYANNAAAASTGPTATDSAPARQATQWRSRTVGPGNPSQASGSTASSWKARQQDSPVRVASQQPPVVDRETPGPGSARSNLNVATPSASRPASPGGSRVGNPPAIPVLPGGPAANTANGNLRQGNGANAQWVSSTTGQSQQPPPSPSTVMAAGPELEGLRQMARPSGSRRFQLEYDIDAIGPDGVREVELWMTRDGGNSWRRWTTDADQRSPVNVEVDEEGIFGFRILVISNDGLRARQPRKGDPADMWVNVDATPPTARITSVPYGRGDQAGQLLIQWQAADANLGLRPVRLQYSSGPAGPWTTIEDGIRNEGQYAWKPTVDIPDKIYLRLEVRDAAGNVQTHTLDRAVDISGLIPRGHIRGITPLRDSAPEPGT